MAHILILADSRKHGGYCVAGKDVHSNRWIRIVSSPQGGALNWQQKVFFDKNGNTSNTPLFKVLDIQDMKAVPLKYQPENYLRSNIKWKESTINIQEVDYYDNPPDLWGIGDKIHKDQILNGKIIITQSLYFIQVNNLELNYNSYNGKIKRRIRFEYNDIQYDLGATMDNEIFDAIKKDKQRHHNSIVVSLGEPFDLDGCHYKLAASIF